MAFSSTLVVTSSFLSLTALSIKPLPVSVRIMSVVEPAGLPTAPAEMSAAIDVRSVQMWHPF